MMLAFVESTLSNIVRECTPNTKAGRPGGPTTRSVRLSLIRASQPFVKKKYRLDFVPTIERVLPSVSFCAVSNDLSLECNARFCARLTFIGVHPPFQVVHGTLIKLVTAKVALPGLSRCRRGIPHERIRRRRPYVTSAVWGSLTAAEAHRPHIARLPKAAADSAALQASGSGVPDL